MIKKDIIETIYEYDKEGKLIKKTVTETHEENNTPIYQYTWPPYDITCTNSTQDITEKAIMTMTNKTT